MRRALDAAKAKLDSLSNRDAILDCFFEHSRALFQFSVLFIVRGDSACGRNVHGLGAPDDLVTRIALPLSEPGVLQRARDLRRPFVTSSGVTEADSRLFGSLGRAMPAGLVVPLVLRDRVVAIFLGDGPAEALQKRGAELGRSPLELAKDEMLVWAEAVGNALERLIMRRKGSGSVRPPGFGSVPPPGMDDGGMPRLPPPAALPSWSLPDEGALEGEDAELSPYGDAELESPRRLGLYLAGAGLAAAALIASGVYLFATRADPSADRTVTPGEKLAGWPRAVDPMTALDAARSASGPERHAELTSIQAEVGRDAKVDFTVQPKNPEAISLSFVFVTLDLELEVRVDSAGVHAPLQRPRSTCGDHPCRVVMPAPICTFAQIREASTALGLGAEERALITYADRRENEATGDGGPGWSLSVVDRGRVHLDGATCKPVPRERLLPPPLALAGIPGAPSEVDPNAVLALARTQSGLEADAVLLELEARGVSSSGRIDLTKGDAGIAFTFADPPTVHTKSRRWREVQVDNAGMRIKPVERWLPIPSRFAPSITPPTCSFAHVFRTVGAVPAGSLATIRYGRGSGAPEAGEFEIAIPSASLRRTITDAECATWEKLVRN